MLISIRKVFFNLKVGLLILGIGLSVLAAQLFQISQYSDRLAALKNQHLLIEKIVTTDLNDPKMAAILINGAVAEIALSVKLSGEEAFFDSFVASNEEQASLLRSLKVSSEGFCDNALIWSAAQLSGREAGHTRMMNARSAYLSDIGHMMDYQIHIINQSISTAKMTTIIIFCIGLALFLLYRYRLNQIYRDIDLVCSVDIDGEKKSVATQEIDFVFKRLLRKSSQVAVSPNLINPKSGLNNEKGLMSSFSSKKSGNTVFLALFEIDHYISLVNTLPPEDINGIYKKLGDMISMYEQPFDVLGHMDDDRLVFLISRNTKQLAVEECEKIIQSVEESNFSTSKGLIKITLSVGFLLKPPSKAIDAAVQEALQLVKKAQEGGGNRIAQLRERSDSFR
ncbi:MAG: GGDEF domain-containing protein [Sulfuricurvum sp.]|uniref:GGDEF domain-containing protein n=1 Tax=Sulfuricurvum sp. TaxID=2025608 RepID=UPI00262A73B2|nr:hypothetical protein [Sulfuricurvum sp.]MDD2837943.1 hypothetical protein [Sulfuricurvum sp.]MDD3596925.1 hypothetical protein [Sulfuricurvum sp.]